MFSNLKKISFVLMAAAFLFLPAAVKSNSAEIQNFGSKYVFNAGDSTFISTSPLSSTKYVIAFRDVANSNRGVAMVATVSNRTVTYGPQAVFDADAVSYISVAAINTSHFSIAYTDGGNSSRGTIITGTIGGGDVITFTASWVVSTGATDYNSLSLLNYDSGADTGWLIMAYPEGGSGYIGRVSVISVVGDGTVTGLGSRTTFNAATTAYIHVSALSASSFIVVFTDDGDSSQGTAMAATISGYTPTFGSEFDYNAASTVENELATLSSTKAVVAYSDVGSAYLGRSRILSVAGTVVSAGAVNTFEAVDRTAVDDVIALSSSTFMVAYADIDLGLVTLVREGSVSGTTITYDVQHYYHTSLTSAASLTALSATKFVASFRDNSNSYFGTSMVADLPIFTHPVGTLVQVKSPYAPSNPAVYMISGIYEKSWVPTAEVLLSWSSWNKIVPISYSELVDYDQDGGTLAYRNCELVKEISSPSVYVFENGQKRHITSPTVFDQYRFSWGNIIAAQNGTLAAYADGADLNSYADGTYPSGCLLKANDAPSVYVLDAGDKRHILTPDVFNAQFSWAKLISVPGSVLSDVNYPVGTDFPYPSGELVKEASSPSVYVFELGLKRHILTIETFEAYNYSWGNLRIVPDGALASYGDGADLTI